MPHRLNYATPPRRRLSLGLRMLICAALLGGVFLLWLGLLWCLAFFFGPG